MPSDDVILMPENVSNDKLLIELVMKHINNLVFHFDPKEVSFCFTLDGHTSRLGHDWLRYNELVNCEIVQAPNDTSHSSSNATKQLTSGNHVIKVLLTFIIFEYH